MIGLISAKALSQRRKMLRFSADRHKAAKNTFALLRLRLCGILRLCGDNQGFEITSRSLYAGMVELADTLG